MSQKYPPRYTYYSLCIINFVLLWFMGELQVTLSAVLQAHYFLWHSENPTHSIRPKHLYQAILKKKKVPFLSAGS